MSQSVITCKLKGITPLLMNKFPMVPVPGLDKKTPSEQAEHAVYRDEQTKELYLSSIAVHRAMINGATYSKGKGRSSLKRLVAACVMITPAIILLGVKKYVVDSQRVVVPATKGAIIRHRPRLDDWTAKFQITYDDILLSALQVRKVVDDTVTLVGFLDFRPEKMGSFGRSIVVEWITENGKSKKSSEV